MRGPDIPGYPANNPGSAGIRMVFFHKIRQSVVFCSWSNLLSDISRLVPAVQGVQELQGSFDPVQVIQVPRKSDICPKILHKVSLWFSVHLPKFLFQRWGCPGIFRLPKMAIEIGQLVHEEWNWVCPPAIHQNFDFPGFQGTWWVIQRIV